MTYEITLVICEPCSFSNFLIATFSGVYFASVAWLS